MLEIVAPVPFILGAVYVGVYPVTVGLIILPFSVKDISVHVPELALAVGLVVFPRSLIARAIWPHLDPAAMANRALPLALVHRSVLEAILISVL